MQKPVDKNLLQLYFRGTCTREQLTIISHYLSDPAYQDSLEAFLQEDWTITLQEKDQPPAATAQSYQQFIQFVAQNISDPAVYKRSNKIYHFLTHSWKVAAAIVFILGMTTWLWWNKNHNEKVYSQWVSIQNEAGRRTSFFLPDSSEVYLGAASTIGFNKGYGITNRQLQLNGEAYFIVKHGKGYPFSVTTGHITTVDIGTEFNIRYLRNSPAIEIAVAKGSVEVLNKRQKLATLVESQQLRFDTATQQADIGLLADNHIGSWRNGWLVFDKQPLGEVVKELERFYDLSIAFTHAAYADILITTTLKNATADEALEIIALTAGVRIKRNGKQVWIE